MVFWKIAMLFGLDGRCIPQRQKHSKTNFTTWSDSTSISNVTVWKLKATRRVAWSGAWR